MLGTWNLGTCSGERSADGPARNQEPWTSERRLEAKIFKTRLRRTSKFFVYNLDLEPGPKNPEPGTSVATTTGVATRGTWNLFNLEPYTQKISKVRACGAGGTWNLLPTHAGPSEPEPRNLVRGRILISRRLAASRTSHAPRLSARR